MKLVKIPPGRFLAQFPPREEKSGLIIIPDTTRGLRRLEVAKVLMKGEPAFRNGGLFDIPIAEGELAWVHPSYGDCWQPEDGGDGEIRSYDFHDYRGTIEEEAA